MWATNFSGDPTAYDRTGDSINDFAMRDDSAFPLAELVSGEWSTPGAMGDAHGVQWRGCVR